MKIHIVEPARVICQNRSSLHRYFAWPSVTRLQDGRLAMVASGFRREHMCPFGKGVICFSADEGRSWSRPAVLIDTPLDDRDCGICAFGENGVVVTSFNESLADLRKRAKTEHCPEYNFAYLDAAEKEFPHCEADYMGSTFVMSRDGGTVFGEVKRMPVSSPHGPILLPDGNMLYIGNVYDAPGKAMQP